MPRWPLLFSTLLITACPDSSSTPDSGKTDAAEVSDAASADLGLIADMGETADLGSPQDTGHASDAEIVPDLGFAPDAEIVPDLGFAPDAGIVPDLGFAPDAEIVPDLGFAPDAEIIPDAGFTPDTGPQPCSMVCQATAPGNNLPQQGLVLWLRSDRGVNLGPNQEACVWCDLSSAGNNMPAVGQPTWSASGAGGHPVLHTGRGHRFERMDSLSITSTAGRTFIAVARLVTLGGRTAFVSQGQVGTPGTYIQIDANTWRTIPQRFGVYVTNNAYNSAVSTSTRATIHTMRMGTMQPGLPVLNHLEYFVDGSAAAISRTSGGLGNTLIEGMSINASSVGRGHTNTVEMSEVLIYNRPISEMERGQIENYLRSRYGL